MKLKLENVGRINRASVEVNGITVIAGENDTGKTTIGKVFYCLLMTFMNIDTMIDNERNLSIYEALCGIVDRADLGNITTDHFLGFFQGISENKEKFIENPDALKAFIEKASASLYDFENNPSAENALRTAFGEEFEAANDFLRTQRNNRVNTVFERILSILRTDVAAAKRKALAETLAAEFKGQIGNVYSEETLSFMSLETDSGEAINVRIEDNEDVTLKKSTNIDFATAYIDGSAALDGLDSDVVTSYEHKTTHTDWLMEMLTTKNEETGKLPASQRLTRIFEKLNRVCDGEIVRGEDGYVYISSECEKSLPLSCISDGQKLFLILKTILMKGNLGEGGMLILDNPENHLHPEWQLLLAEIIVLLQKEFGVRTLINTHSPYLLRGIETYSARYDVSDGCKYYLAETRNRQAVVTDVTGCVEAIYRLLYHPLESI